MAGVKIMAASKNGEISARNSEKNGVNNGGSVSGGISMAAAWRSVKIARSHQRRVAQWQRKRRK